MRLDVTLAQLAALKTMLADACDGDDRAWLDAVEGETDAFEMARKLLEAIEQEEGDRAALTEQMEARKVRRDRCDARIANLRDGLLAIMECAGLDKLPLPEATLSKRMVEAKLSVLHKDAVPDDFCTMKPQPSMERIKAAFSPENDNLPNWLSVEPARPSLTVRRK